MEEEEEDRRLEMDRNKPHRRRSHVYGNILQSQKAVSRKEQSL